MKITKVVIDNFRNIKHVEYDLKDMNIFAGPNGTGKSNTLLAIYWLLNDYLLDGSSDDASNKPVDRNQKTKTSVYLEFEDGWNINKEYWENWVKEQATKEMVMKGNLTQYYIREDKVNVKEARKQLIERLGLNINNTTSNFNLSLALSDPSYIGDRVDQSVLRSFIIDLVGDVQNEDVYLTDPLFGTIRPLITEYDNDPSLVIKSLKKKIKACKDDVIGKEKGIETLQGTEDVPVNELKNANSKIYQIDDQIAIYRQQKVTAVNKQIEVLEKELSKTQLKLSESITSDHDHIIEINIDLNKEIDEQRNLFIKYRDEAKTLSSEYFTLEKQKNTFELQITQLKDQLARAEDDLVNAKIEYGKIAKSEYESNIVFPEEVKCPECGYLINSDVTRSIHEQMEVNKKQFEQEKADRLAKNVEHGKQLKLNIADLKMQIEEKEAVLNKYDLDEINTQLESIAKKRNEAEDLGKELTAKLVTEYKSETTRKLKADLDYIESKLKLEKQSDNTKQDIEDKILKCMEERKPYDDIIAKHNMYDQTQSEIRRIQKDIDTITSNQTTYEQQLATVSDFMKMKLSMLKKNVESVFGTRVNFTLVQANIKEGSWNEVCYPSVLDKETPFIRGSESERIRTGIYMIECIKKKLNIPDIPIIFDRSNDLDTQNLQNLETKAQIITTRVDDIHFDEVTLVHE